MVSSSWVTAQEYFHHGLKHYVFDYRYTQHLQGTLQYVTNELHVAVWLHWNHPSNRWYSLNFHTDYT